LFKFTTKYIVWKIGSALECRPSYFNRIRLRSMSYQIVTANRLLDGHVVYLNAAHVWSEDVKAGVCVDSDAAGAEIMEQAQESVARQEVVDPYLVDVEIGSDGIAPLSFREKIRAEGPTGDYAAAGLATISSATTSPATISPATARRERAA
jgi:hypothetical protein